MRDYGDLVRHPGNESLFWALELSLLGVLAGRPVHVHAEGLRGTGKTSIMRAIRRALPSIVRVRGCIYQCDPAQPHCPEHRGLSPEQIGAIGSERVPMPYLEISHSAKIGTVVGSLDLSRLTDPARPVAALLPGTIPQAHRGIIFVDEINRLADTSPELADVLLDVMGTRPGRVQIEETGLPAVELPVAAAVWAASNPDEDPGPLADIRRQLSDRFDFFVAMARPADVQAVEGILERSLAQVVGRERSVDDHLAAAHQQPDARTGDGARITCGPDLAHRLTSSAERLPQVQLRGSTRRLIAECYTRFGLESLRAAEALQFGAWLAACWAGRAEVTRDDLARVTPLVLRHRLEPDQVGRVEQFLASGCEESASARTEVAGLASAAAPPAGWSALPQAALEESAGAAPQRLPAAKGFDGLFQRLRVQMERMFGSGERRGEAGPRTPRSDEPGDAGRDGGLPGGWTPRAALDAPGAGQVPPSQAVDPVAPPWPARQLSDVGPLHLVFTEDELARLSGRDR